MPLRLRAALLLSLTCLALPGGRNLSAQDAAQAAATVAPTQDPPATQPAVAAPVTPPAPVAQGTDIPTFRASVQLVQLDVVVTDAAGRPVTSLQAGDFEVRQDGRPQAVRFAEFIAASAAALGAGSKSATKAAPAAAIGSASATSVDGPRRIVIVVDERFMAFDSVVRTREALTRFVDESIGSGDLVAIAGNHQPVDALLEFTADRQALTAQVERLRWESSYQSRMNARDLAIGICSEPALINPLAANAFRWGTLSHLTPVLSQLRSVPGRKAVFIMADGINSCPNGWPDFNEQLRRLGDVANRSSVVIYGIQTSPFTSGVRMPEHRAQTSDVSGPYVPPAPLMNRVSEAMVRLSERTGGFAKRSNDLFGMLDLAARDHQGFYLLAYEPPAGTFESKKLKYRKISVRVRRDDLRVRAREGFYSVSDDAIPSRD